MTTKVHVNTLDEEAWRWEWRLPNGNLSIVQTGTVQTGSVFARHSGGDTPNYNRRKAAGELLPINAFEQREESFTRTEASYEASRIAGDKGRGSYVSGGCELELRPFVITAASQQETIPKAQRDYVVQKAAAKYYTANWDGLTFAAELRKTKYMFTELIPRMRKLIEQMGRGQYHRAISSLALEWRYGWRTLLFDIEDVYNALCALTASDRPERFIGRGSSDLGRSKITPTPSTVTWQTGVWEITAEASVEHSLIGYVIGDFKPPPLVTANPVNTAWELTRLSFVIDRFVNVGQWLAALQFVTFNGRYQACYGMRTTVTGSITAVASSRDGYNAEGLCKANFSSSITRRVPVQIPLAPIVNIRTDVDFMRDLWALASQANRW